MTIVPTLAEGQAARRRDAAKFTVRSFLRLANEAARTDHFELVLEETTTVGESVSSLWHLYSALIWERFYLLVVIGRISDYQVL